MKQINLVDIVDGTSTNIEGVKLYCALNKHLKSNEAVILSLKACTPLSSSFLNSSIGNLIEDYGFDYVIDNVKISNYSKSIGKALVQYLDNIKSLQD